MKDIRKLDSIEEVQSLSDDDLVAGMLEVARDEVGPGMTRLWVLRARWLLAEGARRLDGFKPRSPDADKEPEG